MSRFVLLIVLLIIPTALAGQWLDPDHAIFARDKAEHFVFGGIGGNLFARSPWIAHSWRNNAPKRLGWCLTLAMAWEVVQAEEAYRDHTLGRPDHGIGLLDIGAAMAGCGLTELVL